MLVPFLCCLYVLTLVCRFCQKCLPFAVGKEMNSSHSSELGSTLVLCGWGNPWLLFPPWLYSKLDFSLLSSLPEALAKGNCGSCWACNREICPQPLWRTQELFPWHFLLGWEDSSSHWRWEQSRGEFQDPFREATQQSERTVWNTGFLFPSLPLCHGGH